MPKVSNVYVSRFSSPVVVRPGDTLTVNHTVGNKTHQVSKCVLEQEVTWTHSILFELDGELNHIIGTVKTVNWIKGLEANNE